MLLSWLHSNGYFGRAMSHRLLGPTKFGCYNKWNGHLISFENIFWRQWTIRSKRKASTEYYPNEICESNHHRLYSMKISDAEMNVEWIEFGLEFQQTFSVWWWISIPDCCEANGPKYISKYHCSMEFSSLNIYFAQNQLVTLNGMIWRRYSYHSSPSTINEFESRRKYYEKTMFQKLY